MRGGANLGWGIRPDRSGMKDGLYRRAKDSCRSSSRDPPAVGLSLTDMGMSTCCRPVMAGSGDRSTSLAYFGRLGVKVGQ
jgi:hypothetical protein